MEIFHEFTGIFVEDSGKEFLWVLEACEGADVGCVSANIETSQHCFSVALADGCFASDVVGWGGFFIGLYVGRGRGICFSDILEQYVQGGYSWIATRRCRFRYKRCRGLGRRNIWGPLWRGYSWSVYPCQYTSL